MKRYILTGTPGSGKTSIIRLLERMEHVIAEEAATDVIALEHAQGVSEPWSSTDFIDKIVVLQKQRQVQLCGVSSEFQFYDRSPICTYALAVYLGHKPSTRLLAEMERIKNEETYETQVFFIDNLGFCKPSEARKISFENSLHFEKIHEETYAKFGYECVRIAPQSISERTDRVLRLARSF